MRQRILLVPLVLFLFAPSCSFAQDDGTLDKIKKSGEIVFGYRETASPFSYIDSSEKPMGFSIDLCNKIASTVKAKLSLPSLTVTYQPITASNRIPLLLNGAIDMECGSTTNTLERQSSVDFLDTIYVSATRVMVLKKSGISSIDQLKGKAVAVTAGTNNIKAVQAANQEKELGLKLVYGKDHAESFLLLQTGRVAGFATDDILLYSLKASSKQPENFDVVGDVLSTEPYALMIRKNDQAFKEVANAELIKEFKSSEYEETYNKWFNAPIPPRNITLGIPISEPMKKLLVAPNSNGA